MLVPKKNLSDAAGELFSKSPFRVSRVGLEPSGQVVAIDSRSKFDKRFLKKINR